MMPRHRAVVFVAGIAVFVLTLAYLVYGGIQQGTSYWVTVSKLRHRPVPITSRGRFWLTGVQPYPRCEARKGEDDGYCEGGQSK